jgi:hypothetical protein
VLVDHLRGEIGEGALVLVGALLAAGAVERELEVDALKGSPFWNFTPLRSLKV